MVFLDTPGIHQARSMMNKRMVDVALDTLHEVDGVCGSLIATLGSDRKMSASPKPCARSHVRC
jgi:GTPase Era involved in 16S rRNA processing